MTGDPAGENTVVAVTSAEGSTGQGPSDQETSRRRLVMFSSVVLGVVVLLVGAWFLLSHPTGGGPNPKPTPTPSPSVLRQPTLLFQLQANKQPLAVGNALTSVGGPKGIANDIGVPSNGLVDAGGAGPIPLAQTAALPDTNAAANALSDVTGIRIDATLSMDALAFSGLVDAVGGIFTDVDVEVTELGPDGTTVVVLPAGKGQTLQGPKAAAYATFRAPGESEEARMARFDHVFRLVLAQLPHDESKMEEIITSLGSSAHSSVPTPVLAAYLVRLHDAVLGEQVVYRNLPVLPVDTSGEGTYRVDILATSQMARNLFPEALRIPGPNSKVRALVQNGVGIPGLNDKARSALLDAGYSYIDGGNAASFGRPKTTILVPDSSPTAMGWGAQIAKTLGVPTADVRAATHGQTVADVIVVLGMDFVTPSPTPSG